MPEPTEDPRVVRAIREIEAIFGDTSVPHSTTRELLEAIVGEAQERLAAVDEV